MSTEPSHAAYSALYGLVRWKVRHSTQYTVHSTQWCTGNRNSQLGVRAYRSLPTLRRAGRQASWSEILAFSLATEAIKTHRTMARSLAVLGTDSHGILHARIARVEKIISIDSTEQYFTDRQLITLPIETSLRCICGETMMYNNNTVFFSVRTQFHFEYR